MVAAAAAPSPQSCTIEFEYDSVGIGESLELTVLFVLLKPAGCGIGLKVPLKHMPLGDTDHPGDYSLSRDTITVTDTDGKQSIGIRIVDDDIPEPDEQFLVFFGDMPTGITAAKPDTMRVTINDDDSPEPSQVQNLRARPGDTEVTLEWDPPLHGNPPDSYEYSYWEGDTGPVQRLGDSGGRRVGPERHHHGLEQRERTYVWGTGARTNTDPGCPIMCRRLRRWR